jgi:3-hydroxyacyl-CoA dehydrogenase
MTEIKKIAVLGSGVMGHGIAALVANAGYEVLLLDIVPEGAKDRDGLAKAAIQKGLDAGKTSPFTHKRNAKRITPGNLEDDLGKLAECDWIIEVVLERLDVKQALYKKINAHRKKSAIVSSNTSTLPLHVLLEGMPEDFRSHFLITHFFNPPRFMRLLEIVTHDGLDAGARKRIEAFADVNLGKGIVHCNDTPGFIANRIGVYWLMVGLLEGIERGIAIEDADAVMGKPLGIPKTGVFGLFDLIGIDLMPLIAKSMLDTLPKEDAFVQMYQAPELVTKMIADGYTGRKGKGGFYRLNTEGGKKAKESINLKTGEYAPERKSKLESADAARGSLRALIEHPDAGGQYARAVLLKFLHYTLSLIPEIASNIQNVDAAMRWGYNWKYGPFELVDKLAAGEESGTTYLARVFAAEGWSVPQILTAANGQPFYKVDGGVRQHLNLQGGYESIIAPEGAWLLADVKLKSKPIKKNGSCALWDIGDGIVCLEFTSKMNTIDPDILGLIETLPTWIPENGYKGLVVATDGDNLSVGANLGFFLYAINTAAWNMMSDAIRQGQRAYMGLKYAPFPVVVALNGMALGGGCELTLHADAVQAHIESYPGLVEVGVGVIPGWGGCKELIVRHMSREKRGFGGPLPKLKTLFELIGTAQVGGSADQARDMLILNEKSRITMNRARLLADAKQLCQSLIPGYTPPEPATVKLPGMTARIAFALAMRGLKASGKLTPHDEVVMEALGQVLTGGETDTTKPLTEQQLLDLEHEYFMQLIKTPGTIARIEHMLATGKPLRN